MRHACVLTLALLSLTQPGSAQLSPDSSFRALDTYLRSELTRLRIPGAAVAVVRGDSLVYSIVFGQADGSGRPVTLETPFMIGSITKSVTAVAVMQLVDDGRLALDSPVTRYLPWFQPTVQSGWGPVTIGQLLNQNSGVPGYAGRMDWAHPDTSDAALATHARRLANVKLTYPPGTTFEYANANYVLLGEVIQQVSRMSYERYVEEHIFRPLEMNRSFASLSSAERDGFAAGYRFWFAYPVAIAAGAPFLRANLPAGQLIASVADMARYMSMHLDSGRYPGGTIVSSTGLADLHRPAAPREAHWSYAMGWMSGILGGQGVLWHDGLVPGFYAFMALIPERHQGIVILTNAGNLLDMPRLNRAAFGALALLGGGTGDVTDPSVCALCPVSPLASESTVQAVRATAVAVLALQCGWIAWSVRRRRWRSRKANIRSMSFALLWAGFVLFALPVITQTPPSVVSDIMPDLAAVVDASVAIAIAWAFVRVVVRSDRFGRQSMETLPHSGRSTIDKGGVS
jgi:CubicO group peptidase (beta-lactamase class C family)